MPETAMPRSTQPRPAPCPECRLIKAAYVLTSRAGDRVAARGWIAAMGRHHRAVH
ncbi:hypothetical protein [Streptomyces syringium]|uniref:hypothetical protein n=1 Tax=Streptomyces syringium TaxID=76729 RepID=UPI0034338880